MLSPFEKRELLRRLEDYERAWEVYVDAVSKNHRLRYNLGATVGDIGEQLKKFINEEIS